MFWKDLQNFQKHNCNRELFKWGWMPITCNYSKETISQLFHSWFSQIVFNDLFWKWKTEKKILFEKNHINKCVLNYLIIQLFVLNYLFLCCCRSRDLLSQSPVTIGERVLRTTPDQFPNPLCHKFCKSFQNIFSKEQLQIFTIRHSYN